MKQKDDHLRIVWERPAEGGEKSIEAYESLVRQIEAAARGDEASVALNEVVMLVDSVRPMSLSAVAEGGGWDALLAMLILTFPEIRWVFGVCMSNAGDKWKKIKENHSLSSLLAKPRRESLFGPTGLRDWVRERTNEAIADVDDLRLPFREEAAAAIDEEKAYAYFHAYIAYRFGYRVDAVTTWALMLAQFKNQEKTHAYDLLLEDMSLNFPDRRKGVSLLRLSHRATEFPHLDSSRPDIEISHHRILVTTGQARPGDDTALAENRAYLRAKAPGKGKIVFKPASGMFDVWEKCGLFRKLPGSQRKGNAQGFCWPPKPPQPTADATAHGAPGKLLLIAEMLIYRAQTLLTNVRAVEDAVRGAVLATDALELTGSRTPTTATEALSLKHRFEVMAECQFSGVKYHLNIRDRIEEIEHETTAISLWFHRSQRTNARLNAEMNILHVLMHILRDHNRFDEEQICMSRIRHLHNTLWMRQYPPRHVLWPLLRYLELLLSSFAVFVAVLALWVIALSFLYYNVANYGHWYSGLADAVSSFFAVNPPISHPESLDPNSSVNARWEHVIVSCVAILGGFIHLGVFVSHLYSITSRR